MAAAETSIVAWGELKPPAQGYSHPYGEQSSAPGNASDGFQRSQSKVLTELKLHGSSEVVQIPVLQSTTVWQVKESLAAKLGVDPMELKFVVRQGCSFKQQANHEEVGRRVTVKGITSFTRQRMQHPHPIAIIGAGHIGLRQAMRFLQDGYTNFVVFDRHKRVGGMAWHDQANSTSKLQTETGNYHLQFGRDAPFPKEFKTPWPTRDELLEHFHNTAEEYGILPYTRMCTDVTHIKIIGKHPEPIMERQYEFTLVQTSGNSTFPLAEEQLQDMPQEKMMISGILFYPGNLAIPRQFTYAGEEAFDGDIDYAMSNAYNYASCTGETVVLVGHGAFAVENVRTCSEYKAKKIFMVCRRKNIACPRVVSWIVNATCNPLPAGQMLDACVPMYQLVGLDPWSYYAVKTNEARTNCYIDQKVRFGIGDVYFLSIYYGALEVIVDDIDHLSKHTVHLTSSRVLKCKVLLKLLGFIGNAHNDKLMQIKQLTGHHVDHDPKRWLIAEPVSVQAANFSTTSFSAGCLQWTYMGAHFMYFPHDYLLFKDMLPTHAADASDPETYRPAYVVDARYHNSAMLLMLSMLPGLQERVDGDGHLKATRQIHSHPTRRFLAECREDWNRYCGLYEGLGYDRPRPAYPYTEEVVSKIWDRHEADWEPRRVLARSLEL